MHMNLHAYEYVDAWIYLQFGGGGTKNILDLSWVGEGGVVT